MHCTAPINSLPGFPHHKGEQPGRDKGTTANVLDFFFSALTSGVMRGGLWMATAGIAPTDHAIE